MKNLVFVFFVFLIAFGCESEPKGPKTLDWNKTTSEQQVEVGDTIVVEGITDNIVDYRNSDGFTRDNTDEETVEIFIRVPTSYRNSWDEEISIPLFNPEQPDVTENPNVPIGIVICTIYNPSHNKDLQTIYETYPKFVVQETRIDAAGRFFGAPSFYSSSFYGKYIHPLFLYRFRFTGTIRRIGRQKVERVSLHSLDIEVSDVVVISSEQLNELEDWRTDSSLESHTINVKAFRKELESIQKEKERLEEKIKAEEERLLKEQEK